MASRPPGQGNGAGSRGARSKGTPEAAPVLAGIGGEQVTQAPPEEAVRRSDTSEAGSASERSRVSSESISPEARRAMIAEAAYYRAQQRGFTSGYELEDWLQAEQEIDAALRD
jgi:hypothetical protein